MTFETNDNYSSSQTRDFYVFIIIHKLFIQRRFDLFRRVKKKKI